jgi:acetylornithine/N-succinyldiaminopimelate aminotransferase
MTAGTHGSTFGGNALAMAVGNAMLDVMLEPGFLESVRRKALLFKQRLAEMKDRHPTVIAEMRGEGLLLGLQTAVPNGEFVAALRAEKMLAAAAGDNVVRMLPPLVVTEADIAEAIDRIDRAATRIEQTQKLRKLQGAAE